MFATNRARIFIALYRNLEPEPIPADAERKRAQEATHAVVTKVTFESKPVVELTFPYQLDCLPRFRADPVSSAMDKILTKNLLDVQYEPDTCRTLIVTLTDEILQMVKWFKFGRYKFIVRAYIGEKKNQDVRIASRGLWDIEIDGWASTSFENYSVYASAAVYAFFHA